MERAVDPDAPGAMPGQQSWYILVSESGQKAFARLAIHRVPLHNGRDLALDTDSGPEIPGHPVSTVVYWDALETEVIGLMPDPGRYRWAPEETFLVVEPVELEPEWHGLGVAELLLSTALVELQTDDDAVAVAEPVLYYLKGRARTAAGAFQKPIFQHLGFSHFRNGIWLLPDWTRLHLAHVAYQQRFHCAEVDGR